MHHITKTLLIVQLVIVKTGLNAESFEPLKQLCQCLSKQGMVRLPSCGTPATWSKYDTEAKTFKEKPWVTKESGIQHQYVTDSDGALVIVTALQRRDDGIYRCSQPNPSPKYYNLTLFADCFCRVQLIMPITNHYTLKNLHGNARSMVCSALIGPCASGRQCVEQNSRVTWSFSRPPNVVSDDLPTFSPMGRGTITNGVEADSLAVTVKSTYKLENIGEGDYGTYTCTIENNGVNVTAYIQLEYGVPEWGTTFPAPAIWFIATVLVASLATLIVLLLALGYYWLLKIRVFYHLRFGTRDAAADVVYDAVVISTDAQVDAVFLTTYLLPKARENNLRVACSFIDFDLASEDASYLDFMRQSSRIIFLVSSYSLVEPSACTRAFTNAGAARWHDFIFIVMPDINAHLWTEHNMPLREVLEQSGRGRRLDWGLQRRFCCWNLTEREEKSFWDKFLLAMPKPRTEPFEMVAPLQTQSQPAD